MRNSETQSVLLQFFVLATKPPDPERSTITAFIHHTTIKVAMRFVGIKAKTPRNIITSYKSPMPGAGFVSNSRQITAPMNS